MYAHVVVGGRRFGGYTISEATLEVSESYEGVILEDSPSVRRQLSQALLGKRAPKRTYLSGNVEIFEGETYSRAHLQAIFDGGLENTDFDTDSWPSAVRKLAVQLHRRSLQAGKAEITVEIRSGGVRQSETQLGLTMEVARWLGSALLRASREGLTNGRASARLKKGRLIAM